MHALRPEAAIDVGDIFEFAPESDAHSTLRPFGNLPVLTGYISELGHSFGELAEPSRTAAGARLAKQQGKATRSGRGHVLVRSNVQRGGGAVCLAPVEGRHRHQHRR